MDNAVCRERQKKSEKQDEWKESDYVKCEATKKNKNIEMVHRCSWQTIEDHDMWSLSHFNGIVCRRFAQFDSFFGSIYYFTYILMFASLFPHFFI